MAWRGQDRKKCLWSHSHEKNAPMLAPVYVLVPARSCPTCLHADYGVNVYPKQSQVYVQDLALRLYDAEEMETDNRDAETDPAFL